MHTGRSRNDIDLTMYRLVLRSLLLDLLSALLALRARLVDLAWEHRAALMPAYTHNQPAQPTTFGHYLMAYVEVLERDSERILAAFARVNRSPLGACAITTTGFALDRYLTAALLGFDGLQVNSYGAIAAVDYLLESCSTLAVVAVSLGRFSQDLLLWSTDAEDALQPLVYAAFDDGIRSLSLLAGVLGEAEFHTARMAAAADANFLPVTELADTLVRETGISFRAAHHIVSSAVKELTANGTGYDPDAMIALIERDLPSITERFGDITRRQIRASLSAQQFVDVRSLPGGPAPIALEPEILRARQQVHADGQWLSASGTHLREAHANLHQQTSALIGVFNLHSTAADSTSPIPR